MDHLLNINPYRVINADPFSTLIQIDNNHSITLVLYSSFSNNWTSMNEIHKALMELVVIKNENTIPYFLDTTDPNFEKNYNTIIESCNQIICLHFNKTIGTFIKTLKTKKQDLNCFFVISSSLKSLGYQFKYFGLDAIDVSDTFLCLCESDNKILQFLFPENKVETLSLKNTNLPESKFTGSNNIVFFGRLNEVKNISILLSSLHAYKMIYGNSPEFKIHLFGEIDYTGKINPYLGNYQTFLQKIIEKLNLKDKVIYHGFKSKNEISDFVKKNHSIGVFLSTYHNENYSMAVREFIDWNSSPALITSWGAHQDIIKIFKNTNRVFSIDVNFYKSHSNISPFSVAKELNHVLESPNLKLKAINHNAPTYSFSAINREKKPIDKNYFLSHLSQNEENQSLKFNSFYAAEARHIKLTDNKIYMHPLLEVINKKIYFNDKKFLDYSDSSSDLQEDFIQISSLINGEIHKIPKEHLDKLFKYNLLFPSA